MPRAFDLGARPSRRGLMHLGLGACSAALVGCGDRTPAPRAVRLGRETCQNCGMTIGDARWCAEVWDREYSRVRVYDDFGCAILDAAARKELDRADMLIWAADETEPARWLDARGAHFRAGVATPMGYGYAAGPQAGHPLGYADAVAAVRARALCDTPTKDT